MVSPIARRAAMSALEQAEMNPKAITHLITVSCTGFAAPGFDLRLIHDLKLDHSIHRTHLGFMGCHGRKD